MSTSQSLIVRDVLEEMENPVFDEIIGDVPPVIPPPMEKLQPVV